MGLLYPCQGVCRRRRYRSRPAGGSLGSGGSPYGRGYKRCMSCYKYIRYDGIFCPCCHMRLRGRPRRRDGSKAQREKKNKKQHTMIC